jgi:hypothetical protein
MKAQLRIYYGHNEGAVRLFAGSIKSSVKALLTALIRLYEGSMKALLRLY